jgi:hypothetical protein
VLDVLGESAAANTLLACSSAGGTGFTDIFAVPDGPTIGGVMPHTGREGFKEASATITGPAASSLRGKCRDAQMERLRSGLGQPAPNDPGYQAAVDNAVSAMDEAAAQCRDSGASPIAEGDTPQDTPSSASQPAGRTDEEEKKPNWFEYIVAVFNGSRGIAEIGKAAHEVIEHPSAGGLATAAIAVIATGGTAAGVVGHKTAETVSRTADVAQVAISVAEISEAAAEAETTVGAPGSVAAAAGFDIVLPLAAIGAGTYAATRLVNEVTGGSVDYAADYWAKKFYDAKFEFEHGTPTGGRGVHQPDREGGKPSCSQLQARWKRFKEYCSQPGNNWKTNDCAVFVAKMNGCADPSILDAGPEGDYVCRAKCKGGISGIIRSHQTGSSSSKCTEDWIAACEHDRKVKGWVSQPGPSGNAGQLRSCGELHQSISGMNAALKATLRKKLCERANADFCDPSSAPLPVAGHGPSPIGPGPPR